MVIISNNNIIVIIGVLFFCRANHISARTIQMADDGNVFDKSDSLQPSQWTPIETPCFQGRIMFKLRDFDSKTEPYFRNRTRYHSVLIQGQFKRHVHAHLVQTGQEFKQPIRFPPMTNVLLMMLRRVLTDVRLETSSEGSFLALSSVLRTAQRVNVSRERISWDITAEIKEDTRLLGGYFAECDRDWNSRRKFCSKPANLASIQFKPEFHYSFEFFHSFVDLRTFALIVSRWKVPLQDYLNGQPIRIMARILESDKEDWKEFTDENLIWDFSLYPRTRI